MGVSAREQSEERFPVVHMHRGSAIRRPLIVLAVCAVAALGYVARDFLIPTAGAIVLALILTPVANTFERLRVPAVPVRRRVRRVLLAMGLALLARHLHSGAHQLDRPDALPDLHAGAKARGRAQVARRRAGGFQAGRAGRFSRDAHGAGDGTPPEKVVVREKSLMAELASTTPGLLLQAFYAAVLAFLLLAHRNSSRRQIMRIPASFNTRVRLAKGHARHQRGSANTCFPSP